MRHRTVTAIALVAGLLALGGCGTSQAGSESAMPPTNQLPAEQEWITGEWENWVYSSFIDHEIGSPFILNSDGTGTITPAVNGYAGGLYIKWSLDIENGVLLIDVPSQDRAQPIIREVRGDAERLYLGQPGYGTAVYQRGGMAILPPSSDAAASIAERPLLQAWLPTVNLMPKMAQVLYASYRPYSQQAKETTNGRF